MVAAAVVPRAVSSAKTNPSPRRRHRGRMHSYACRCDFCLQTRVGPDGHWEWFSYGGRRRDGEAEREHAPDPAATARGGDRVWRWFAWRQDVNRFVNSDRLPPHRRAALYLAWHEARGLAADPLLVLLLETWGLWHEELRGRLLDARARCSDPRRIPEELQEAERMLYRLDHAAAYEADDDEPDDTHLSPAAAVTDELEAIGAEMVERKLPSADANVLREQVARYMANEETTLTDEDFDYVASA